ncbi:hypothetical protein AWN90_04700 [Nocardia terpenica]|uniref:NADP-dependent oxidoreductase domain-containing protein n=2 Tax=Nocardia terpenica TaxID=455432 RepID=A0A164J043_9NOCA|nr:hypothetical protein AWN90_04700 [Nocardia terpenica]
MGMSLAYGAAEEGESLRTLDRAVELGAAFLDTRDQLTDQDNRRRWPRFARENVAANLALADDVTRVAAEIGCAPAQAALAWLLAQGEDIVAIPGTKRAEYLEQNAAAADLELTAEHIRRLAEAVPGAAVAGDRYPAAALNRLGL